MLNVRIDKNILKRLLKYVRYISASADSKYWVSYDVAVNKWNYIIKSIVSKVGNESDGGRICPYQTFGGNGRYYMVSIVDPKTKSTVWDVSFENIVDGNGNTIARAVHGIELDKVLASADKTMDTVRESFTKKENPPEKIFIHNVKPMVLKESQQRKIVREVVKSVLNEKLYNSSVEPMIDRRIGDYDVLDGSWTEQILCDIPQKGWIQDICMYSAMNTGGKTYALYRRCDNGKYFFTEKVRHPDDEYIHTNIVSYKSVPSIIWNDAKALIRNN